ncbi:MAG TPA: Ig-like domain repeat protein [Nitrososphaera sp.]|nr:Ig-like domain repeat protein [Nitrososphaera sp.]
MENHGKGRLQRKQKLFSTKSLPIALAVIVFTGLIVVMPLAPLLVFALNIDGTSGNDTLNGTPDPDTINGFEGNDIISGEGGDDILDGGRGSDEIRGGEGNDGIKDGNVHVDGDDSDYATSKVYGGSGNDNIDVGHSHSDYYYVYGEAGVDYIKVVSNAAVWGGIDDDTIYCTAPDECGINGDEGNDEIHIETNNVPDLANANGGSGNDKLYIHDGGGGLVGGDGNDYLFVEVAGGLDGGEGDDILETQQGETDYRGGNGADTFKCSPGSADKVQDYSPEEGDQIVSAADCELITTVSASNPNNLFASFTSLVGGDTLSGIYEVQVSASPLSMVSNVKLYVDDSTLVSQENNAPYEFPLDTTKFSNGNHVLKAVATYNTGETVATTVTVKFENQAPEPTPPPQSVQTALTLNTITNVPWGKELTVTGKLVNSANNAGIGGKTIAFDGTGADNIPDVVTNTDGTFTVKGASPTTVATGWKVQAHFASGSGYTTSDSSIKAYSTVKHSVTITISSASSNVPWSMPTKFTATLKDASLGGAPIPGKTIHFDGTGVMSISDKMTDSIGKASGTGTAPNTVATGWTYQAHFAGDSLYNAKDSSTKSYSTTKHSVSLSLSVTSNSVSKGASYKVSGTLTDSTAKNPLASKTITFTAENPLTIGDKTTSTNGVYSATQTAPNTAGSYDIQSQYAGDSLYNARDSSTKTLTVS